jgi:hypothetical protein
MMLQNGYYFRRWYVGREEGRSEGGRKVEGDGGRIIGV